ncbi:MAG: hypothetical protein HY296_05365 [Thaumarchaeota archaeon]|nr:hypothetical protein [Nitrososphaerota archaeon]
MTPPTDAISCCFDEESRQMLQDYRRKGLGKATKMILAQLKELGISGTTSLELGCGGAV